MARALLVAVFLGLVSCRGTPDLRDGPRALRLDALLDLRGSRQPADVAAALDLLEDTDVAVRWTAARNLLVLPPGLYGRDLVARLPHFPPAFIRMGLEVLRRSGFDFDPEDLLFLADYRIPSPPGEDPGVGEERATALRRRAAEVLAASPRRAKATAAMLQICRPDLLRSGILEHVACGDRDTLVGAIRDSLGKDPQSVGLLIRILDDPRAATMAVEHLDNPSLWTALERTDSRAFIEGALDLLRRRGGGPDQWYHVVRALSANTKVNPESFASLGNDEDRIVRSEAFKARVLGMLRRDAAAGVRILDGEKDVDIVLQLSLDLVNSYGLDPNRGALADLRAIGSLLETRHELIRQRAAASIVALGLEPHVEKAQRVLEEATELHLTPGQFRTLERRSPEMARRMAWKILRGGKTDNPEGLSALVEAVLPDGSRELFDLLDRRRAPGTEDDGLLLKALARAPRPGDRDRLRAAIEAKYAESRFDAAAGLLRLGEADALPVFLTALEGVRPDEWIPAYEEFSRHPMAIHRDLAGRLLVFLRERLKDDLVAAAILPAWRERPSELLATMAGRLGRTDDLVAMLGEGASDEAAFQLGYLPGEKSRRALLAALEHKDYRVIIAALGSLILQDDPNIGDHFIRLLPRIGESGVLDVLVPAIVNSGSESAMKALAETAKSGGPTVLYRVAQILIQVAPEEVATKEVAGQLIRSQEVSLDDEAFIPYLKAHPGMLPVVVELCASPSPLMRSKALRYLGILRARGQEAVPVRALGDDFHDVREAALEALLRMDSPAGVPRAREMARGEDFSAGADTLASAVVDYLAAFDEAGGIDFLRRLLRNGERSIRWAAIYHLARTGTKGTMEAILDEWTRHPDDSSFSFEARKILHRMTGLGEEWDIDQWQEWLADHWRTFPARLIPGAPLRYSDFIDLSSKRSPPAPFEGVALEPLKVIREWQGVDEGEFRGEPAFLIRDAVSWRAFWRRVRLPAPAIDLEACSAVVLLYPDPDPANISRFSVDLAGLVREEERTVIHVVRRRSNFAWTMVDHAGTLWHVFLVPNLRGPVEFKTTEIHMD